MQRISLLLLTATLLIACSERPSGTAPQATPPAPPASQPAERPAAGSALPDFAALVRQSGAAVVNIVAARKAPAAGGLRGFPTDPSDPFFEFFRRFMPDIPERGPGPGPQGQGSGFIISQNGYVLTNAHVVEGSDEVTVRLADAKREFKAKVVGVDNRTDVALLKVDATGLPTLRIGSADRLQVGEWVAAIGSPFGFANSITAGIVSAKDRELTTDYFVPFIQTDVAVNPGNSGGPLLNLSGEVVGINSMIYSGTGGYMGVSFAIPIDVAMQVAEQLRTTGRVTRGRLGVAVQTVTGELAQSFGLNKPVGVVVAAVEPGTPAAQAGLAVGDVILRYNGEEIDGATELTRLVANTKPGTTAVLDVWRQQKMAQIKVTIGELPAQSATAGAKAAPQAQKGNRLGLAVSVLPPEQRKALGVNFGLVIEAIEPDVKAPQLQPGDVIVAINNVQFSSIEEFNRIVEQQKPGSFVPLLIRRGEAALYVPVRVKS